MTAAAGRQVGSSSVAGTGAPAGERALESVARCPSPTPSWQDDGTEGGGEACCWTEAGWPVPSLAIAALAAHLFGQSVAEGHHHLTPHECLAGEVGVGYGEPGAKARLLCGGACSPPL